MLQDSNDINPLKLLSESLSLSVAELGRLLRIPHGTIQKMTTGERPIKREVIDAAGEWYRRVDEVAIAFYGNPDRVPRADLPRILHRAVYRRQQEMMLARKKRKVGAHG